MASTAAHAGNSASPSMIEGQQIHIDAPRNCASLDCLTVTGCQQPQADNSTLKGFGSTKDDDDDVAAGAGRRPRARSGRRRSRVAPAPAPVATTAPVRPSRSRCTPHRPPVADCASTTPAPLPALLPSLSRTGSRLLRLPPRRSQVAEHAARRLGDRREQGQCSRRTVRRQSVRLCREDRRAHPDQHEARGLEVDRPHPRSRLRQNTTRPSR